MSKLDRRDGSDSDVSKKPPSEFINIENRYQKLYEDSPDMYRTVTTGGIIIDCNKAYVKQLGYTREEIIGKAVWEHIAEESIASYRESFNEWLAQGTVSNRQITFKRKDGTTFPVLISATNLYDNNGNLIGSNTIIKNISAMHEARKIIEENSKRLQVQYSQLKQSHDRLMDTERKYKTLYEGSPDLYRTINIDGIIVDCNNSYAAHLGYTKAEVVGATIFDHVAERSVDSMRKSFEEWKKQHHVENREMWFKKKDGTIFPVLLSATNLYDIDGNLIGSNTAIKDITEIYLAQKKLEESEARIKEQLIAITALEVQKGEFLSMMSHELKTPLTPLIGLCQTLLDPQLMGDLRPEQKEVIETLLRNTRKINELISDLLDAQKLDLGRMKIENKLVDITAFMNHIENNLKGAMVEKQITILNTTEEKVVVTTDPDRLGQVFDNLILNSVDFVAKQGTITFGAKTDERNVIFYVSDNGIGIPLDKQDKLFQKFFQGDTSLTRRHGGTGLGLAICKGIIERLGGKIWCDSEPGKGTTFHFTIPKEKEISIKGVTER